MRSYEQVGPRFFPYMVGAGLIILGAVLAWQAASGGWRNLPLDQEGHDSPNRVAARELVSKMVLWQREEKKEACEEKRLRETEEDLAI